MCFGEAQRDRCTTKPLDKLREVLVVDADLQSLDVGQLGDRLFAEQRLEASRERLADNLEHNFFLRRHACRRERCGNHHCYQIRFHVVPRRKCRCAGAALQAAMACASRRTAALGCSAAARNSRAACTPPGWWGTPAAPSPISTPASVPASIRSLKAPRWPMRNTLPVSLVSPAPSDMS